MTSKKTSSSLPYKQIQEKIYWIRSHKVMLDSDLALLYEVQTKVLLQSVKRNLERFPDDFMFQLTKLEYTSLRSQIVTLKDLGRGQHRKYFPYAFTENGVAMLSSVLKSPRAIGVNILIMRTFTHMREMVRENKELWDKVNKLEKNYDKKFKIVFDALRTLLEPPKSMKKKIGFHV